MAQVEVVILAAGQSSRLYPLTLECPKSLLPFNSEPILVRMIRQFQMSGITSIRVVVGHLKEKIVKIVREHFGDSIEFINNENYLKDINTLSLYLGLAQIQHSALVVEADVLLSNDAWDKIDFLTRHMSDSVWFTFGKFLPHQAGGIIKSNADKHIIDMKLVPKFEAEYADYSKNLGIFYIGQLQLTYFKSLLSQAIKEPSRYYMQLWIENLDHLPCKEINLFPSLAGSFNTLEELEYCHKLFAKCDILQELKCYP